jgi:hypothetical protein
MPSDIKAALSILALLVVFAYAYWEWTTGRGDLALVAIGTGIFAVISMWIFPEAMAKKRDGGDSKA